MILFCIFIMLLGAALRAHCMRVNLAFDLLPKTPDSLCVDGAYKYVRHPSYLGSIIIFFGFALLLTGFWVAMVTTTLLYLVLADRARQEESLIVNSEHSNRYKFYQEQTGFIFPKVANWL